MRKVPPVNNRYSTSYVLTHITSLFPYFPWWDMPDGISGDCCCQKGGRLPPRNAVDFLMAHCNTTDRIRQYILFNVQWQVVTLFQMGITTHPSHFSVGSTASSVWTCPYQDWCLDGISLTMFCKTLWRFFSLLRCSYWKIFRRNYCFYCYCSYCKNYHSNYVDTPGFAFHILFWPYNPPLSFRDIPDSGEYQTHHNICCIHLGQHRIYWKKLPASRSIPW